MNAKNPKYASNQAIDLEIEHPEFGWIPFTASAKDVEQFGRSLCDRAISGEFGRIAEYIRPSDIVGEYALAAIRSTRNEKLKVEVDPVVSNPLRWADMTAEQQQAWYDYRRSLLDITTAYPNPSFVWNENKQGYDETNIVWPVKPQ